MDLIFRIHTPELPDHFDAFEKFLLLLKCVLKIVLFQQLLVFRFQCFILLHEVQFQVAHTQSISACLVHVGGANAFEGGSNFGFSLGSFRCGVQNPVRRKYEVCFP